MTVLRALLALFLIAFAFPAMAAEGKEPEMPAPIKTLVDGGAQVRYLGREGGLDGWLALKGGQPQYFYVTPDLQTIIMGVMFNSKGDVITMKQINTLRSKEGPALDALAGYPDPERPDIKKAMDTELGATSEPDFEDPNTLLKAAAAAKKVSKSEKLFEAVSTANWVAVGQKDAPAIYSFIDPECPHCHDLIKDVRKSGLLEKGDIQLRLIPVGLISEESLQEAAMLLAAPNAQDLLFKHLDGDAKALVPTSEINTQGVQRNMSLMQEWKFDVTPFSVYKTASGEVKILRGRPENLKKLAAELR